MKYRSSFLFILLFVATISLRAQQSIQSNEIQVNFGLGGNVHGLPLYTGVEFGVTNFLSLGITYNYLLSTRIDKPISEPEIRLNIHFGKWIDLPAQWDFYSGLKSGLLIKDKKEHRVIQHHISWNTGAHYYWNQNWAVNLDLNIGVGGTGTVLGFTRKMFTQK